MSYELNFWRCAPNPKLDHKKVYQQLCEGVTVNGLDRLPINELIARVSDVFADWNKLDDVTFDGGERGGFQLYTTSQYFRVDCYEMDGDGMNKFVEIGDEFGCRLYDPQVDKRFDET